MTHNALKRWAAVALVALMLASLAGCGKASTKAGSSGASTSASSGSGTSGSGKTADPKAAKVTKGKNGEVIQTWEKTSAAPQGFPADFPVYDATIQAASKVKGDKVEGYYVGLETKDSFKTVFAWYKAAFAKQGWKVGNAVSSTKNGVATGVVTAKKGDMQGGVTLLEQNGSLRLAISLNIIKK